MKADDFEKKEELNKPNLKLFEINDNKTRYQPGVSKNMNKDVKTVNRRSLKTTMRLFLGITKRTTMRTTNRTTVRKANMTLRATLRTTNETIARETMVALPANLRKTKSPTPKTSMEKNFQSVKRELVFVYIRIFFIFKSKRYMYSFKMVKNLITHHFHGEMYENMYFSESSTKA